MGHKLSIADIGGILSSLGNMPEIKNVLASFLRGGKEKQYAAEVGKRKARKCTRGEHKALICAIKPYLSEKRRAAVEPLISALDIFELIG